MKILIATGGYPPDIGGPATYSELLFRELPRHGVQVDVLSWSRVRHLPKGIRHIKYLFQVIWHARAADVVFAQDAVSVGLPALIGALVLGKILIVRVPGDHAWEQSVQRYGVTDSIDAFQNRKYGFKVEALRRIQRLVVSQADQVIAPSRYFAGLVRGWTNDPDKVAHVYNGVNLGALAAISENARIRPRTIVSAGRLVPWKGFGMLIRAMKKLPGWTLEIAGDGPEMENLKKLIAREGAGNQVSLLGRVEKAELLGKIAGAEIFALNTSFESFSFQIVEAMALGAPVIATRVGNLAEIVDDGVSGILIDPDDESRFLEAANRISSNREYRAGLISAAKKKSELFSIDATIGEVMRIINGLNSNPDVWKKHKVMAAKIGRYLFSGGLAAVTDLVLLYIFTDVIGMWYLLSSVIAFIFAFMVSFIMQKFFTFQDHQKEGIHGQAAVYLAVTGTNLLINTGLVYLFVQYAGFHYMWAQILTSILIAIESFVIYGMFIFKKK